MFGKFLVIMEPCIPLVHAPRPTQIPYGDHQIVDWFKVSVDASVRKDSRYVDVGVVLRCDKRGGAGQGGTGRDGTGRGGFSYNL